MPALLETRELAMPIADDERLNVGDTAHFISNYSEARLAKIVNRTDLSEIDRLQLIHEQLLLVRGGIASSVSLLPLARKFTQSDSEHVWDMIGHALAELRKFVETDVAAEEGLRRLYRQIASPQYERLGWTPQAGESEGDTKLRSAIISMMIYSRDPDVLSRVDELYAAGIDKLDPEIRPLIIGSVVHRSTDEGLIRDLVEAYRHSASADLRDDISSGLTSAKQPGHVDYLLAILTDTDIIRSQDTTRWFVYLIRNRYSRSAAWEWMKSSWGWINDTFGSDKSYDYFPRYAATGLSTAEQRRDYQTFFEPLRKDPALTRTIDIGMLEIDARLELLERDGGVVRQLLTDLDD